MEIFDSPLWSNWPIYVIGDSHWGDGSKLDVSIVDCFSNHANRLIEFIEQVTALKRYVIINGDWLELIYFNLPSVLKAHGPGINYILSNKFVILIPGNHTSILNSCMHGALPGKVYDRIILGKWSIFHGHELDDLVNKPWLRKPTKLLAKIVTKYSKESDSTWLINWARQMSKNAHENAKLIEALQGLDPVDSVPDSSAPVILSHTHQEYDYEHWYYNTGSFSTIKEPYLEVWPEKTLIKYNG